MVAACCDLFSCMPPCCDHLAKTRHLERQAVLAIEEKLKLLEQSPPKPLDESMVEFLRSQISNGCSGAAPVHQAQRDGHFSDGSADMMPSAHSPISPEASSQPLFAKDCDDLTLLPSNMSGGSPKQDGCRRDAADADIPPPLPSSPPPNVSGRQRMASSSTDDNSSLVVGGEFASQGPSTTDGLLNGERQMVTVVLTASPQTKTSEKSVLGSSSESTTSDCGDLYQNGAARKWAEPEVDGSYGKEPRNSGGFPFPRADQNGNIRHDGESATFTGNAGLLLCGSSTTTLSGAQTNFSLSSLLRIFRCACISFCWCCGGVIVVVLRCVVLGWRRRPCAFAAVCMQMCLTMRACYRACMHGCFTNLLVYAPFFSTNSPS